MEEHNAVIKVGGKADSPYRADCSCGIAGSDFKFIGYAQQWIVKHFEDIAKKFKNEVDAYKTSITADFTKPEGPAPKSEPVQGEPLKPMGPIKDFSHHAPGRMVVGGKSWTPEVKP